MKNNIELQLRALRAPRVLKKSDSGDPELVDVWAIHHSDHAPKQWAIAVKFGTKSVQQAGDLKTRTLFTVKGQLDQTRNPKTGIYHTFIWADSISDLTHSIRSHPELPMSEADMPVTHETTEPEPELPHA